MNNVNSQKLSDKALQKLKKLYRNFRQSFTTTKKAIVVSEDGCEVGGAVEGFSDCHQRGTSLVSLLRWHWHVLHALTGFLPKKRYMWTEIFKELYLEKACKVNLNHSSAICDNLANHTTIKIEIQKEVAGIQVVFLKRN